MIRKKKEPQVAHGKIRIGLFFLLAGDGGDDYLGQGCFQYYLKYLLKQDRSSFLRPC
jgi:hypothetical protein